MTNQASGGDWSVLRGCWLDLQDPRLQADGENEFCRELPRRHAEALAALVACEEMGSDAANRLQMVFREATDHVQQRFVRCYLALPAAYAPREDLTAQAAALAEMAERGDIDPTTVARARDSLARDIAWLRRPSDEEPVGALPAETEAARILAELLVGNK